MSCHDIGRGVDAIMAKVLEMYDDGKISQEAALEMVAVFPRAVHWCDGNEYEAQDTLTNTHCAACLHKYGDGEKFVCYDEVDIRSEDFVDGTVGELALKLLTQLCNKGHINLVIQKAIHL